MNNNDSLGAEIINHLVKKDKYKGKNKKDNNVNVVIDKTNLMIIDYLAELFGYTRSYIVNLIVSEEIESMFNSLPINEKIFLSEKIDDEISNAEDLEHQYLNETWMHKVKEIPIFNPFDKDLTTIFYKKEL